jgi:cobaltochelatase CobT
MNTPIDHFKSEIENRLNAALHATSADPEAKLHLKKHFPASQSDGAILSIPLPQLPLKPNELQRLRGEVDLHGMYLRHHNISLHQMYRPHDAQASHVYDNAEAVRLCLMHYGCMEGITHNIEQQLFATLSSQLNHAENDTALQHLGIAIPLLIHQRISRTKLPPTLSKLLTNESSRQLSNQLTDHLECIIDVLSDQAAFNHIITQMIQQLFESQKEASEHEPQQPKDNSSQIEEKESNTPATQERNATDDTSKDQPQNQMKQPINALASFEETASGTEESEVESHLRPNHDGSHEVCAPYYSYTREFDETIHAADLVSPQELTRLRHQLDERLETIPAVARKHVNQFVRKVMATFNRRWQRDQEFGIIDAGKLSRVIANPGYSEYYKIEQEQVHSNTVVTLLLDNSGSMRGRPITVAAMSAELLAKALESCGIRVEILGFTTAEWKGGKSRKKWQQENSPKEPGRLNDLRHIIYKTADMPWRSARKNLGVMLKEGILKENIDGEAIMWACERLALRPEERRILMVISDGAPVDDSTISTNSTSYLDTHLKSVISLIEQRSAIELLAIGIGHDVNRYYQHAVTLRDVESLSKTMFAELALLLERA